MIKMYFLPHLESFMWERKFEKKFFKKSPIQPPNGVLFIFKLPFLNGSYRNGVCRGLWAKSNYIFSNCLDLLVLCTTCTTCTPLLWNLNYKYPAYSFFQNLDGQMSVKLYRPVRLFRSKCLEGSGFLDDESSSLDPVYLLLSCHAFPLF